MCPLSRRGGIRFGREGIRGGKGGGEERERSRIGRSWLRGVERVFLVGGGTDGTDGRVINSSGFRRRRLLSFLEFSREDGCCRGGSRYGNSFSGFYLINLTTLLRPLRILSRNLITLSSDFKFFLVFNPHGISSILLQNTSHSPFSDRGCLDLLLDPRLHLC